MLRNNQSRSLLGLALLPDAAHEFGTILFLLALFLPGRILAADITLLVLDNNSYLVDKAVSGLDLPAAIKVRYFPAGELRENPAKAQAEINDSRIIIIDVMGRELVDFLASGTRLDGKIIYALRGSTNDKRLREMGFRFDDQVAEYYRYLSTANVRNMVRLVARRHLDRNIRVDPVIPGVKLGIYHPRADRHFTDARKYLAWYEQDPGFSKDRPWAGILFFSSSLTEGQRRPIEYICRKLEKAGFNILPCFGRDRQAIESFLLDARGKPRVDIVLACSLKFYSALGPELAEDLRRLDIPIVNAVSLYRDTARQWRQSPVGISANEVSWSIATPEVSGLIEPTVLSAKKKLRDPVTGKTFYLSEAVRENVARLIPRLRKWIALQRKPNQRKKVAILFYNHHQGKQNVGASYLNVFRSLEEIIQDMGRDGYRTGSLPSEEEIKNLILGTARNIGSWAPGELDRMLEAGKVIRLPLNRYKTWFARLPADFRKNVVRQWGPVEKSGIMIKNGSFIIPAVRLGNLVLLPEPARGWGDEPMKLYHDTTLYPHHQYLAVYLWLAHEFQADAMIHLGTHATYEWTPGKQAGLSPSCPPEVLITDIPNLYPYIVDDVGEGIQAKRRGRGVMISHLSPMLRQAGLHEEYRRMAELVNSYERALARGSATAPEKLKELLRLAGTTGILKDLQADIPQNRQQAHPGDARGRGNPNNARLVRRLGHYLEEIKENLIPYGMHTFGRSPGRREAREMARAVAKWNSAETAKDVEARIFQSGRDEMNALLKGLDGRFVEPGQGNDPVRNPAALPTGRNFYGFNPTRLPTPAAWKLGKKAAEEIIASHSAGNHHYPAKVAVVLWATETMRNEGVNESTILWLMGIRPRWSKTGRVLGMEAVPGRVLGRPRIDVMINASGLYRDLFPDRLLFLDQAVQLASRQTDIENLISRHNRLLKGRLIEGGMSEKEAESLSRLRIFSEEPGSYGTGVAEMAAGAGIWEKPEELVDVFENRAGFVFGAGKWGAPAHELFRRNLAGVEVAVHSRSSNLYGLLDNDDMFQYLGGLSMAVRRESGKSPETLITRQQKPGTVKVEDLARTLGREMRSRYLNPEWIRGMKREDYAGAREMAHYVEYLWGWQVTTPDKVDAAKWRQTYEVYVQDKYGLDLNDFFSRASPWAYQSMTGRMLEAIRKGYWQADEQVRKKLAASYAVSVVDKGVACCDHTCNNPLLNQMVVSIISLPGVMSPEMVKEFKLAVEQAAGRSLDEQVARRRELQRQLSAPGNAEQTKPSRQATPPGQSRGQGETEVEGYRMEKLKNRDKATLLSSSGVEWFASLTVLFILGLAAYGAKRKKM